MGNDKDGVAAFANFVKAFSEAQQFLKVEGEIEFPLEVSALKLMTTRERREQQSGSWVSIRVVGEAVTRLGVYLGDLGHSMTYTLDTRTKEVTVLLVRNPAIWVPDLKRVVWGCESWWGVIKTPEQLREITDADINDIWYVRALRELQERTEQPAAPASLEG